MAKTISLKNINHSFLERTVLIGANLKITESTKMCIVGENGAGKSTLLKIIARNITPISGAVDYNGHIRTHYVAQEFLKEDLKKTVREYVTDHAGMTLFKKVFTIGKILGFNLERSQERKCELLSGGQQKILSLSVGLAIAPDFLLLDEPENHLDIVSRQELMVILKDYRGAILFISHDRVMIDAIADKVTEITAGKTFISEGGYEDYVENKLSRIAGLQRSFDTESKRIRQLQANIGILQAKAFRGKETSAFLKAQEEIKELKEKHRTSGRPDDKKTKIVLKNNGGDLHDGKLLCRVENLSFGYKGMKGNIMQDVTLDIRSGSHAVLLGRNGSGKSTFLKCLTGDLNPKTGTVVWSENVKRAYFDQHADFDPTLTPIEVIAEALHCDDKKARSVLGMMKFNKEKMETIIRDLSGGERMRVRFALVFGSNPDFIILDEPTNHLDEITWEILLEACNASKSTILLVTHDHEFIDGLEEKTFWLIKGQSVSERHKDLDDLIEELR